jgi:hypothetical protein
VIADARYEGAWWGEGEVKSWFGDDEHQHSAARELRTTSARPGGRAPSPIGPRAARSRMARRGSGRSTATTLTTLSSSTRAAGSPSRRSAVQRKQVSSGCKRRGCRSFR